MAGLAFYAPMKSPNHPVPSGDREMARSLMKALLRGDQGEKIQLVSEMRCYDGKGDSSYQDRMFREAEQEAQRLLKKADWDAWVTYHNYYKAPDLLGPVVSRALGIPYFQIEATRASKRLGGPWDRFEQAAQTAIKAANAIFYVTQLDGESLRPHLRQEQQLVHLAPFLPRESLPDALRPERPTILSVAMMRPGAKLASYRIIAEVLKHLEGEWTYEIAGDGPARAEIEALFAPFGHRVRFLGQLDKAGVEFALARATVFLWPGANEAFGMVYLEAQAAGVPVVAQDRPGVRDVLPSSALVRVDDFPAMAAAVSRLLVDKAHWALRATQAQAWIHDRHLIGTAEKRLWSVIGPYLKGVA